MCERSEHFTSRKRVFVSRSDSNIVHASHARVILC
jgi:hypothetical protein